MRTPRLLPALVASALTLPGCLELTEVVAFEPDGSGTLSIYAEAADPFGMGGDLAAQDDPCPRIDGEREGLRVIDRHRSTEDGRLVCREVVEFDAVELLAGLEEPTMALALDIERDLFSTTYRFRQTLDGDPSIGAPGGFADAMLGNTRWRFQVTLPGRIVASNADTVSDAMGIWSPRLSAVLRDGLALEATSRRLEPARLALAIAAVIGLLLLGTRRSRRPATPATASPVPPSPAPPSRPAAPEDPS